MNCKEVRSLMVDFIQECLTSNGYTKAIPRQPASFPETGFTSHVYEDGRIYFLIHYPIDTGRRKLCLLFLHDNGIIEVRQEDTFSSHATWCASRDEGCMKIDVHSPDVVDQLFTVIPKFTKTRWRKIKCARRKI